MGEGSVIFCLALLMLAIHLMEMFAGGGGGALLFHRSVDLRAPTGGISCQRINVSSTETLQIEVVQSEVIRI